MDGVREVLERLAARQWTLAVAESDTGGVLLEALTSVPGSSAVVLGGLVAYHDRLKGQWLGVPAELVQRHGSVSAEVAEAMAAGMRRLAGADLALATTGIAGPGGARPNKPVGLAFVAAATAERAAVRRHVWSGGRDANRRSSARAALRLALEILPVQGVLGEPGQAAEDAERSTKASRSEHMCYDSPG